MKQKRNRVTSTEAEAALATLYARFGKYAIPDKELRKLMDKALGDKGLSEEVRASREE